MSRSRSRSRSRVEVVRSREGQELRVDGTFASFYRPGSAVTGSVWDAIAAPVLALPPKRRRRFLVLGLGAGSAARVLRAIAPESEIVGVELDPEVVRVARKAFDLDALGVEIVVEDALSFLRRDQGRYDAIFDDVFVGEGDGVHKPGWLPWPGHRLAAHRLAKGGVLVSNTLDEASEIARALASLLPTVVSIEVEDYDNRILAAGPDLGGRALRAAIGADPVLATSVSRFRLKTLTAARSRSSLGS